MIWSRTRETNRLRNALREYYPAALVAFEELDDRDALAVLGRAPDPATGARLSPSQLRAALRAGGSRRYLDVTAERIQTGLRTEQLAARQDVTAAYAATTRSAVALLVTLNTQIDQLEDQLGQTFDQHPDADIYLSLPGLGDALGARVLGEFGVDPERFADAKSRRNYAGTSPLTKASGKRVVMARFAQQTPPRRDRPVGLPLPDQRPGARAYYDERRAADYEHHEALRALGNRWIGILHGCLKHGTVYDEHTAWAHRRTTAA